MALVIINKTFYANYKNEDFGCDFWGYISTQIWVLGLLFTNSLCRPLTFIKLYTFMESGLLKSK